MISFKLWYVLSTLLWYLLYLLALILLKWFSLWYISYILVLNGANSEVIVNSDKSFYEHCVHSNKYYSIVLSLIISDDIKESTIKYFIWYHAQNLDQVLDSGGALHKKDKFLSSVKLWYYLLRNLYSYMWEICTKLFH